MSAFLKVQPEDFRVDELALFEPCGDGDHLYLRVQKRCLSTPALLTALAARCGLNTRDLGCAGRKDTRAITDQWVSLPTSLGGDLEALPADGVWVDDGDASWTILGRARHRHRLKTGQLKGNRFSLLLRGLPAPAGREVVARCAEFAAAPRLINVFGQQRFGAPRALDQARWLLKKGRMRSRRDRFVLSVAQAAVFNSYLHLRGWSDAPITGEWYGTAAGGRFDGARATIEELTQRLEDGEIVPLGPLPGTSVQPIGRCGELVAAALAEMDLEGYDWARFGKRMQGAWRRLHVAVDEYSFEEEDDGLRLRFALPAGSYATILVAYLLDGVWPLPKVVVHAEA